MSRCLITAGELSARCADEQCVIVDCRFNLLQPSAGRQAYSDGHIPGARYAHLDEDLAAVPAGHQGRHPLPDPMAFAATLGSWGISNDSFVVAYDDANGAIAARLWWMLRWLGHREAAVLDGGLRAWAQQGHSLEQREPVVTPSVYEFEHAEQESVVGTEQLPDLLAAGATLLDARSAARFDGRTEPIDPVAGHVPGAVNLPFDMNVSPDGTMRSIGEIRKNLEDRIDLTNDATVIAMCGSGVTACHLLLAMEHCGMLGGKLYAGSWSEWIRDPSRPIATKSET